MTIKHPCPRVLTDEHLSLILALSLYLPQLRTKPSARQVGECGLCAQGNKLVWVASQEIYLRTAGMIEGRAACSGCRNEDEHVTWARA